MELKEMNRKILTGFILLVIFGAIVGIGFFCYLLFLAWGDSYLFITTVMECAKAFFICGLVIYFGIVYIRKLNQPENPVLHRNEIVVSGNELSGSPLWAIIELLFVALLVSMVFLAFFLYPEQWGDPTLSVIRFIISVLIVVFCAIMCLDLSRNIEQFTNPVTIVELEDSLERVILIDLATIGTFNRCQDAIRELGEISTIIPDREAGTISTSFGSEQITIRLISTEDKKTQVLITGKYQKYNYSRIICSYPLQRRRRCIRNLNTLVAILRK